MDSEPFTLVEEARPRPHRLFDDVLDLTSAKTADHDLQYISVLRAANPGTIVTAIPTYSNPLLIFARAGFAVAELDTETDSYASWRGYVQPRARGAPGGIVEKVHFAKYRYTFAGEPFILYSFNQVQYVLKERRGSEAELGPSKATDVLITAVGEWLSADEEIVWVYDMYWTQSKDLWNQVQKAKWSNVILDPDMKHALTDVSEKFFDSKEIYEHLGVPWKRGLIFHGPPGNGKTISIKALMHTLLKRKLSIPTLYVKNAPTSAHIRNVFQMARSQSPCLLVLEDIETIVTSETRSYFFNEVDGLENNDGIMMVASTNFLDRLDPGLSKRPSRFDRTYRFPLPNQHERIQYCELWRERVASGGNIKIEFPERLCSAMAGIMDGFSFAYMQEAFVATLLVLARREAKNADEDDLDKYEIWVVMKEQVKILRGDMGDVKSADLSNSLDRPSPYIAATPPSQISVTEGQSITTSRAVLEQMVEEAVRNMSLNDTSLAPQLDARKVEHINSAAYEYK